METEYFAHIEKTSPNWKITLRVKMADCLHIQGCEVAVFNNHWLLQHGGYTIANDIADQLNKQENNNVPAR